MDKENCSSGTENENDYLLQKLRAHCLQLPQSPSQKQPEHSSSWRRLAGHWNRAGIHSTGNGAEDK